MPKRPHEWRVDSHGCYKFDNAALGFGPRDPSAHLPVFLHLRTTNLPCPHLASCAANMHNKEEWNAGITNMTVREEDVHDRDPVRQGHVSAFLFALSAVALSSFAGQLCLPTALTLGTFCCKSLSLSLSLSLCRNTALRLEISASQVTSPLDQSIEGSVQQPASLERPDSIKKRRSV